MRNIDRTLKYAGPIIDIVQVEIFFKRHKKRMSIDVIGGQKQGVILEMPWLAYHNLEIDQRTGEVQIMRCPEKCEKKWRMERQTKLEW